MKKYFAIFAAVAILGMLAIYFVPSKKIVKTTVVSTTISQTATPSTDASTNTTVTPSTAPTTSGTATTAQSAANSGTYKNGTYNGSNVSTRFGNIKVAITVSGGEITNVDFLAVPSDDMRSQMISSQATPMLESQTIAAQSANIDGVSGATYTSNGYAHSLQSAIDAAKI